MTARGNARQSIFYTDDDRQRFLEQLDAALEKDEVILYAYVLMRNHWHLFVETPRGNIDRFMQRLSTAYSMYFRYRHARPGHCLQGRYHAKLVGGDDYILRVTRYVHLNPVKTEVMSRRSQGERKAFLANYRWSSYQGYVKREREEERIDYRWRKLMHGGSDARDRRVYQQYVDGMVAGRDELLEQAMEASRYAIGDEAFVAEAEDGVRERARSRTARGDIALPLERTLDIREIEGAVARAFSLEVRDLHAHGHHSGVAKAMAIELCCRLSGVSQRGIAEHFGYRTDAGVTRQRSAWRQRLATNDLLAERLSEIRNELALRPSQSK